MLRIETDIVKSLPSIDVQIDQNDDPSGYLNRSGLKYPVVQVSQTVLSNADILVFLLSIGSELPELTLSFNDIDKGFQTSDLLETDSEIIIFIGSTVSDEPPVKLQFTIYDFEVIGGSVRIEAKLKMSDEIITIPASSINDALTLISECCAYGVNSTISDDLFIYEPCIGMTVYDALCFISKQINKHWFIDQWYNITFIDIDDSIGKHQDTYVTVNYLDGETLPERTLVQFSNSVNTNVFLGIQGYEVDYLYKDPQEYEYEEILFDKSWSPELSKPQVSEGSLTKLARNHDLVSLNIVTEYSPYMNPGFTVNIEVWTKPNVPRRVPDDIFRTPELSDQDVSTESLLIDEYSGIFVCVKTRYEFFEGEQTILQRSVISKLP